MTADLLTRRTVRHPSVIPCPNCDASTFVRFTAWRKRLGAVYRRRCCTRCSTRVTTYELSQETFRSLYERLEELERDAFALRRDLPMLPRGKGA